VRYLDLPQSVATLRVRAPLRVLVVLAGPRSLPPLDAEGEWRRLKATLGPLEAAGALCLERLPDGTLATLRRRARGDPFHILHFIGHGGFDAVAGDGMLHFENAQCLPDPIAGQMLGNILRDHDTLRLVVLNACEGARQSDQNPFSGVAQSLCQQRMPAVIAMQFEISDEAAKTFAEEFYGAIADGLPVDAAVSESRKALYSGRFGQEWATPVLYMRSPSGLLFDIQKRPKQPEPAKPIQPPAVATQQPVQQPPVQQPPVQQPPAPPQPVQRPAPPPPPPPRLAFDVEAERRKLDAERARLEAERVQRERAAADAEARRRNEEERLKEERLRFEQEQAQARIAAEAQRKREEQDRRQREEQARHDEQQRREQLEAQYREQERARAEETRRKEQIRQQQEREAAAAAAAARPAPPPPTKQQPVTFVSVTPIAPPKKHRLRKSIVVTFAIIGAVLLTLLIIGLIVGSNESRVNQMRAGEQAMDARHYDEAITNFRAAVAKHPEMAEAHARLCNAIALKGENSPGHKGDYAAAVSECEEAVSRNPDSSEAHSNLCNALNDREFDRFATGGNFNRAIAECRQAIKLDPNNAEAQNNLCNVVGTRAEQHIADPLNRKEALVDQMEGATACKEALRLKPDYAEAHKNLGDIYSLNGDDSMARLQNASAIQFFNQAAAEYRQALSVRSDYQDAERRLGEVFYKNNKPEAAREELSKAVSLDPGDDIAHFWLGNVYFRELKQNDEAITEFKRVVELKPDLAAGEFMLSQVYRAQGDSTEADAHLTTAYNRDPNDKSIAFDYRRYIVSGSSSPATAPTE
jgi:tetratricopeptide (TPR) repeat protein